LRPRGTAPKRLQPHNWHGQGAARGRGGDGGIATTCPAEESLVHEIQDLGRAQCQRRDRQRRRVSTADGSKAKQKRYAELLGNAASRWLQGGTYRGRDLAAGPDPALVPQSLQGGHGRDWNSRGLLERQIGRLGPDPALGSRDIFGVSALDFAHDLVAGRKSLD